MWLIPPRQTLTQGSVFWERISSNDYFVCQKHIAESSAVMPMLSAIRRIWTPKTPLGPYRILLLSEPCFEIAVAETLDDILQHWNWIEREVNERKNLFKQFSRFVVISILTDFFKNSLPTSFPPPKTDVHDSKPLENVFFSSYSNRPSITNNITSSSSSSQDLSGSTIGCSTEVSRHSKFFLPEDQTQIRDYRDINASEAFKTFLSHLDYSSVTPSPTTTVSSSATLPSTPLPSNISVGGNSRNRLNSSQADSLSASQSQGETIQSTEPTTQTTQITDPVQSTEPTTQTTQITNPVQPTQLSEPTQPVHPIQPVQSTHSEQDEENLCLVCFERKYNIAIIPCGHVYLCTECRNTVTETCAICRGPVQSTLKIYEI